MRGNICLISEPMEWVFCSSQVFLQFLSYVVMICSSTMGSGRSPWRGPNILLVVPWPSVVWGISM